MSGIWLALGCIPNTPHLWNWICNLVQSQQLPPLLVSLLRSHPSAPPHYSRSSPGNTILVMPAPAQGTSNSSHDFQNEPQTPQAAIWPYFATLIPTDLYGPWALIRPDLVVIKTHSI